MELRLMVFIMDTWRPWLIIVQSANYLDFIIESDALDHLVIDQRRGYDSSVALGYGSELGSTMYILLQIMCRHQQIRWWQTVYMGISGWWSFCNFRGQMGQTIWARSWDQITTQWRSRGIHRGGRIKGVGEKDTMIHQLFQVPLGKQKWVWCRGICWWGSQWVIWQRQEKCWKSNDDNEKKDQYAKFWYGFGKSMKSSILEDAPNINLLAKLLRFENTKSGDKLVSPDQNIKNEARTERCFLHHRVSWMFFLLRIPYQWWKWKRISNKEIIMHH